MSITSRIIAIEALSTMFLNNPCGGSLNHFEVYNFIADIGGTTAINYGLLMGTPYHHRKMRTIRATRLSDALLAHSRSLAQ
jgi:hypothetical protein